MSRVVPLPGASEGVLFPPRDVRGVLTITREPESKVFTFQLPNGDSYDLSYDSAARYLEMLGDEEPCKTLDYVYNFFSVRYSIDMHQFVWIPRESVADEDITSE